MATFRLTDLHISVYAPTEQTDEQSEKQCEEVGELFEKTFEAFKNALQEKYPDLKAERRD